MFRVLTIIASVQLLPLALVFEGRYVLPAWNAALGSGAPLDYLVTNLLVSGASYYLYNEVAFWILALVSPITHAIGNTIKRVVIIFASVVILKSPINAQGVLGSTIAIIGTLVYSLILQQSDKRKEKKKIASV
jgi:solute carrier family 35 protein E1